MTRLYISGPVTGEPDDNREAFREARRRLSKAGYIVDIPHDLIRPGTQRSTAMLTSIHSLTFWESYGTPHNDGLALLPGWEQSEGAMLERAVAEACGITCKTVDEWLEEARC